MEISTHAQHVRFIVEIISIFCRFCLQQSHILQISCWLMLLADAAGWLNQIVCVHSAFIRKSLSADTMNLFGPLLYDELNIIW